MRTKAEEALSDGTNSQEPSIVVTEVEADALKQLPFIENCKVMQAQRQNLSATESLKSKPSL
eukprot:scaffold9069_cov90-Cylindrotheca_fusiformis.AAC.3